MDTKNDGTVDGRNPAPVGSSLSHYLQGFNGFYTSQVVVWDFFHQQYEKGYSFQLGIFVRVHVRLIQGVCKNTARLRGRRWRAYKFEAFVSSQDVISINGWRQRTKNPPKSMDFSGCSNR